MVSLRPMPNLLAFETSSPVLSVALQKGSGPIRELHLEGFLSHAENLLPMVDKLLKREKLQISQIDTLLIGRGPGSFTGLRVGFATIKGLGVVKNRACYGALSLDLVAEGIESSLGSHLMVCLDARRQKLYTKLYEKKNGKWCSTEDARVLSFEAAVDALPQGALIAGDGLKKYGEKFKTVGASKNINFLPESSWYPKASHLISWFQSKDKRLQRLSKPTDFLPLYFRLSEAEEKQKEHAGSL